MDSLEDRICLDCGENDTTTKFYKSVQQKQIERCIECLKSRANAVVGIKVCTECQIPQNYSEFYVGISHDDYHIGKCRSCHLQASANNHKIYRAKDQVCTECEKTLAHDQFPAAKGSKPTACTACVNQLLIHAELPTVIIQVIDASGKSDRICRECNHKKSLRDFRKYTIKGVTGWVPTCKKCIKARRNAKPKVESKECSTCNKTKPTHDFHGFATVCKICHAAYGKKNKEAARDFKTAAAIASGCSTENCPFNAPVGSLEFTHHVRGTKHRNRKGGVVSLANMTTISMIKSELKLGRWRCRNCHRIETHNENKNPHNQSTTPMALSYRKRTEKSQDVVNTEKRKRGNCFDCDLAVDESKYPCSMFDFDHRERHEKVTRISEMCLRGIEHNVILAAVAKCDLCCANCEAIRILQRSGHAESKLRASGHWIGKPTDSSSTTTSSIPSNSGSHSRVKPEPKDNSIFSKQRMQRAIRKSQTGSHSSNNASGYAVKRVHNPSQNDDDDDNDCDVDDDDDDDGNKTVSDSHSSCSSSTTSSSSSTSDSRSRLKSESNVNSIFSQERMQRAIQKARTHKYSSADSKSVCADDDDDEQTIDSHSSSISSAKPESANSIFSKERLQRAIKSTLTSRSGTPSISSSKSTYNVKRSRDDQSIDDDDNNDDVDATAKKRRYESTTTTTAAFFNPKRRSL